MFLLAALIVKKKSYFGRNLLYLSKETSYTIRERLSTPNVNLIRKSEN